MKLIRRDLRKPLGVALTHDGFLYVTELDRARIVQIAPDGRACVITGGTPGYSDSAAKARFNQTTGVAIDRRGDLLYSRQRKLPGKKDKLNQRRPVHRAQIASEPLPRLTSQTLGEPSMLWPLGAAAKPHEVIATVGEVRGSSTQRTVANSTCTADSMSPARTAKLFAQCALRRLLAQLPIGDLAILTKVFTSESSRTFTCTSAR